MSESTWATRCRRSETQLCVVSAVRVSLGYQDNQALVMSAHQAGALVKAAAEQHRRLGRVPGHRLHLAVVVAQRDLALLRGDIPHLHGAQGVTQSSYTDSTNLTNIPALDSQHTAQVRTYPLRHCMTQKAP